MLEAAVPKRRSARKEKRVSIRRGNLSLGLSLQQAAALWLPIPNGG
jgi:hypothetical protein